MKITELARCKEFLLLQPFVPYAKSGFVPVENFNLVTPAAKENKKGPAKGIELEILDDKPRKPVYTFSKVSPTIIDINIPAYALARPYILS